MNKHSFSPNKQSFSTNKQSFSPNKRSFSSNKQSFSTNKHNLRARALKQSFSSYKFLREKWYLLLLITFVLLGLYLRIGGIITNSFAFTYDVGRDLLEVQKIVQEFDIPLIGQTTGLGGLYYGPWWYYILTPPFIATGGNPQGIAFFMAFVGILTIICAYYLGRTISGKGLGVILAGFVSFSQVLIGYSNQIWNPNIAPFFLILLFIVMFSYFKNEKKEIARNFLIGFILGIILDAEIVFGVLITCAVGLFYIWFDRKKVFSKEKLFILFGFFITLLPRILFEFRHNFIMTKSLFLPKGESQEVFDFQNFFIVLPERIYVFFNQIRETFDFGFIPSVLICVITAGILILSRKSLKKLEIKLLILQVIILFTFLVGSSFFARAIWGHYIVGLPVVYIVILSIALMVLVRKNKLFGIITAIVLMTISVRPINIVNNVQNSMWEGNAAVYRNQLAVIDYIYTDARGREFNYIAYTPVLHDFTYQYLFSWYGKSKYGYVPTRETQELFYVILEPDPGYEGRLSDWLKVREGDGVILNEKLIKGGISVQERRR